MKKLIEEHKKRIRYMYTWMFRRYRTNTLADGGSISDKPVLGAELIPDASRWFNIDNDPYWTYTGNVNTSGGLLNFNAATNNTGIYRDFAPVGKLVSITFTITSISSGGVRFINGIGAGITRTSIGTYTEQFKIQESRFYIYCVGTTTATIDNISVREVLINSVTTDYLKMAQNNRMDKSIRFGWLGEAGSKITSGRVEKLYDINCFEQLGAELFNETFDNQGDWILGNTMSINSGSLNFSNSTAQFAQKPFGGFVIGKRYRIVCDVVVSSGLSFRLPYDGAVANIKTITTTGRYINDFICQSNGNIFIGYASGFTGSIDNIKIYELYNATNTNNATQTTPTSRPYLTGNIAPNEKLGLKNPNGGSNFMTHPTISFGANDSWSVSMVFNRNGNTSTDNLMIDGSYTNGIFFSSTTRNLGINNSINPANSWFDYVFTEGKNYVITIVCNGSNNFKLYVNGVYNSQFYKISSFVFTGILLRGTPGAGSYFNGKLNAHIIRSQALTQSQVTAEYTYLRSVYPEIESVDIGTQEWATSNCEMAATPMGNVIQEMQAATNVEKITNIADREFSSDTGWWKQLDASKVISGGTFNFTNATVLTYGDIAGKAGAYYKVTYTISNYTSGTIAYGMGSGLGSGTGIYRNSNGTYTEYVKLITGNAIGFMPNGFTGSIDNISVQEIGWSGSQELYDGIYAQTVGTVEQKTYAAVKAAGFWCHYNNSVDNGAIYGKLYNWFAVKLLQMDIDKYNTDNPTALWGWRVPTQADFQTLSTYLGGAAVSGGKLKKEGTTYWNSPNTGADNSSGFSIIGAGFRRNTDGLSMNLLIDSGSWTIDKYDFYVVSNSSSLTSALLNDNRFGVSLRLIKA